MRKVTKEECKVVKGGAGDWSYNCPYCAYKSSAGTQCLAVRAVQLHVKNRHVPTYPVTTCP